MSSFVTGLVRRAAGIPQPVSIRPAVGPAQIPVFPSTASRSWKAIRKSCLPPTQQKGTTTASRISREAGRFFPVKQCRLRNRILNREPRRNQ